MESEFFETLHESMHDGLRQVIGAKIVLAEEGKAHERFRDHPMDNIPRVFAGWSMITKQTS